MSKKNATKHNFFITFHSFLDEHLTCALFLKKLYTLCIHMSTHCTKRQTAYSLAFGMSISMWYKLYAVHCARIRSTTIDITLGEIQNVSYVTT